MKRVAIVGFAPTWKDAPFDDMDCEIWTVNSLNQRVPRADRVFELHRMETLKRLAAEGKVRNDVHIQTHLDWLAANKEIPVYMIKQYPEVPASIPYPLNEMIDKFGMPRAGREEKDGYFTNSISYMIALAIHEGFERIYIYGVDMAVGSEYNHQRPSCEYYVGIAKGMGIEIVMPVEADLLKSRHLYGFEEEKEEKFKRKLAQMIDSLEQRKKAAEDEVRRCEQIAWQYDGAMEATKEIETLWE